MAALPLAHRYLLHILYLQPVPETWQLTEALHSKPAIAVAVLLAACPWIWFASLRADRFIPDRTIPLAMILSVLLTIAVSFLLNTSRATWFFVEWTKVRTPNPSFARNTLFWEQRSFESEGSDSASTRVGLVGSSQTYQGFDLKRLHESCPDFAFEKNTLAGFGPMQYPFLWHRMQERKFDIIVCQLSEFDFFREDSIPVSRLRWASSASGVAAVADVLTTEQQWSGRSELADLSVAAAVPLWRQRDHFRRTVFGYWWKKSDPPSEEATTANRLADTPGLEEAIGYLKKNVGEKKLVDANFQSFRRFAEQARNSGVHLIVLEGHVHPDARSAYDVNGLQLSTRSRLKEMSAASGFEYHSSETQPAFQADDFSDAYHLNDQGQAKLSLYLASVLDQRN